VGRGGRATFNNSVVSKHFGVRLESENDEWYFVFPPTREYGKPS
jgi:hypothetical protein